MITIVFSVTRYTSKQGQIETVSGIVNVGAEDTASDLARKRLNGLESTIVLLCLTCYLAMADGKTFFVLKIGYTVRSLLRRE